MSTELKCRKISRMPRVRRMANAPGLKTKKVRLPKARRLGLEPARNALALPERRLVDFQLYHPTARSVEMAGALAGGGFRMVPLENLGGGAWLARLLLAPGRYEYHYVVDGEHRPDPLVPHVVKYENGIVNSLIRVQ